MGNVPVSSALIGRGGELAALLEAAAAPSVRAVLVTGEAGIGKSRLIEEFTARLAPAIPVLIGRCPEFGSDGVPFAPFIAILRRLVRVRGAEELAALLPGPTPAIARWLPELRTDATPPDTEDDHLRLFGELLILLEHLGSRGPAVLILEDLHWADESSRTLLAFLVANLAEPNVLLVATFRPNGPPGLRGLVAELRRLRSVLFLAPPPLTRYEVGRQLAALLEREPEPEAIGRVFTHSGGNPLFVEALSRSSGRTPAELSELLLSAHAGLDADALTVLRVTAVAGSPTEHDLLEAAAGLPAPRLRVALRELVDRHLLVAAETGYAFRHVLIREAVYDDLLPIERTRLHAELARLLRDCPDLVPRERLYADLAHHAFAAGDVAVALTASLAAARIACRADAQPERLRHLERVVALWDAPASGGAAVDRVAVLEEMVDACFRSADVRRGIEAADRALAAIDESQPERVARLRYQRAHLRNQGGTGGYDDLVQALALLPESSPTALRGEVLTELAAVMSFSGDPVSARHHAEQALAVADRLGATTVAAEAHSYLALTAPDSATTRKHFARAHELAATAGEPGTLLTVITWEVAAQVADGDYHAAIDTIQDGLRIAHDTFRFAERGPILLVKWAQVLTALGRWPEATQLIRETLAEPLPPLSTAALHLCQARIAVARGDYAEAALDAERARTHLGPGTRVGQYRVELGAVLAGSALAQHDPVIAAVHVRQALAEGAPDRHPNETWPLLVLAARISDHLPDLAESAKTLPCTSPISSAHRAVYTATMSAEVGDWRAAVDAWRVIPQPYEQAHTLFGCAAAELRSGDRAAARSALRSAAQLTAELGATPLAERIRDTADRAGLALDTPPDRSGVTPKSDTYGLTPRELEVLRLVADGSSNRQLAARLFISTNTVGVHVSRILAKLGVATRTEAAAFARRHHLITDPGR
ncbi:helix-turn-helix transcriptional regulator [Nocardia noduli]|uniref:helix-turn-helix transcriptional regulator n=1 Tax=Nocardia noduli TaxID=2815722 RepID=UPI001C23D8E9|nr:AAA family ATPase [Nocardia noduli]